MGGMVSFVHKGDLRKTAASLKGYGKIPVSILEKYGDMGLDALRRDTPKLTGLTANSWYYQIVERSDGTIALRFLNSNVKNGVNIAVILHYGHATGTGGWVEGYDYINKAVAPIFNQMVKNIWKEVTRSNGRTN